MKSFGNEIRVHQGEDWNLDVAIYSDNDQSIPFIVSSERKNPYFVVTVASTKYEKNLRYVKSWWNSVDKSDEYKNDYSIPRFYQTVPEFFKEIQDYVTITENSTLAVNSILVKGSTLGMNSVINGTTFDVETILDEDVKITQSSTLTADSIMLRGSFIKSGSSINGISIANDKELNFLPSLGELPTETYEHRLLYYYTFESDKIDKKLGHKPYYYCYKQYNENEEATNIVYGYECRIRFNFSSEDTAEWRGQDYMYQITLVSGETMNETIREIYEEKTALGWQDDAWPISNTAPEYAQYHYIKVQWPNEFQPDIDEDSPLGIIETPEVIMSPTKLQVYNNLRILI